MAQGWCLTHVYDTEKSRWSLNVLPTEFKGGISASHALGFVVQNAKMNNALCQKALGLISQFNQRKQ